MHSWVPDTYSEAPIPVGAFLAGTVKGASAFILIRLLFSMHPALDVVLLFISVTALLTVGVGAVMAYTQKDLKRFLGLFVDRTSWNYSICYRHRIVGGTGGRDFSDCK